ncbi:MAG: GNAT family N-acetyltransferase [Candidatus Heimdallarchaeota archaeon]
MTLVIKEQKEFKDDEKIITDFLNSQGIDDKDQIKAQIDRLREKVESRNSNVFVALLNDNPVGFISGTKQWLVMEVKSFYVKEEALSEDCGSKLIKALTEKAFSEDSQYFRQYLSIPHKLESSFEENLEKEGYFLIPRAGMTLDLTDNIDVSLSLLKDYSMDPFTIEDVDQMMEVMVKANAGDHSDLKIYPSMGKAEVVKKIFGGFSNNFTDIDPEINPQIKHNGKIIGMSFVMKQNPEIAIVAEVSLDPEHQRKGLGKALMRKIILECKNNGFKKLGLAVTEDNIGAFNLYKKLGFTIVSKTLAIIKHK